MSEVRFVVNVIVYEDGHFDVIWDSSVSAEDCQRVLAAAAHDMAPPPPTPTHERPTIKRLK
ncbi:hypothetical protein JI721_12350 [Alicyclobacillus cycloheptanicus]|uniref:Uncharacterized protein n=1 Tax=Alicyclobacillus cycloheptanicus TaxID=1457 RepID=A0ABT9XGA0_9BACL|nr:hypothetical protein [Alicyclobacillus cycloheptanicus]MDQ0188853.1 hypothetical protein [Alicyclobacillus cycloheptanicus]WDM00501.1 hypothetical protein JI721_12350 [Alicyclobacillus cycloheptanicus]